MRKRKLYIAVFLILLSWVIGPMAKLSNECCSESITHGDSFVLVYPDGMYMFIQKTEDGTDFTKWAVKILIPEDIDVGGTEIAPIIDRIQRIAEPETMGIYSKFGDSTGMVTSQGHKWIPQAILIFLCGLAGFIFAVPKQLAVSLTA